MPALDWLGRMEAGNGLDSYPAAHLLTLFKGGPYPEFIKISFPKIQRMYSLPELTEIISDLVLKIPRMLVLGDFNLHAETVLTGAAQDFMASMAAMGLSQHVIGPTHERGHTLDLVFSTRQEEVDKAGDPVDALVELWNEMTRAIDTIAPKRPLPPGRARSSPWYTPELRAMKQVGRRIECRWRRSRGDSDRTHLRVHYRAYAVVVRMAKKKFFSVSIASLQCHPAELFWVVQGLIHPGPKKDLVPPSKARCDDFAKHFREKIAQIRHELDSVIESDSTGETPSTPSSPQLMDEFQLLWPDDVDKVLGQEAVVRPVLKKASLDPEVAAHYRPVANIPFLGKVLERVVAGQLQALLDETDYLDPFQSGFRPGYGTESALVALYDDLCRERDRGSASLLVLLDLSAAFDTIDHGILLNRIAGLGVGGTAWWWFRSCLNGRFQKVVLGDKMDPCGTPWHNCHGVPQGSILSPLLFNFYMKPLGEVIRRCGLRNHQYADDTQLYLSFSTNPGEAVAVLSRCLAEIMGWMRANKLKLNPDKTEVLLVGGSSLGMGDLGLVLNGVALPLRTGLAA
ncbi:putative RNA-directed DNA polymerase from transposon BS [Varanus komodoensis]|nr:putative RNA-directed DNA polymerase from transposon BS [Varanus komodoensis]